MRRAVVLLSGGIDSSTTLAIAKSENYAVTALSFAYGQRHKSELTAAKSIARIFDVTDHYVVTIDLRAFGKSALTDDIAVPINRSHDEMAKDIAPTYVPARNTIFLSYAISLAEVREADDIFIGVNALDYGGYPDCRPEYLNAFQKMARLATARCINGDHSLRINAPLLNKTKSDIIRIGSDLGVDFAKTVSCYQATDDGLACGQCDACILRRQGFEMNGFVDPTRYIGPKQIA